jgi:hypothetical protein
VRFVWKSYITVYGYRYYIILYYITNTQLKYIPIHTNSSLSLPLTYPPPPLVFGERSLKCAESLQNLATVLDSLGRSEEAGLLLTKALSSEEEVWAILVYICGVW